MKVMSYDDEIKERSHLKTDELNLFVSAGAGAGKTTSLVGRITYGFQNGILPSEVVAITFTNKSAEDLRKKIIEKLDELKMVETAEKIDEMHISTIHKFCDDILREKAIDAHLSPDYVILSPEDDLARKQKAFKNFVKHLSSRDLEKFENYQIANYQIISDIKSLYFPLTNYVEHLPIDEIYQPGGEIAFLDLEKALKGVIDELVAFVLKEEAILLESYNDYKKEIFEASYIYKKTPHNLSRFAFPNLKENLWKILINPAKAKITIDSPFNGQYFKAKQTKEVMEAFKADLALYDEEINKLLKLKYDVYAQEIFKLAYRAYEEYLAMIDQDINVVSNDQLIYKTYELLKNRSDVRKKLQKKYKHLYVDEYQDTDHLQMEIAKLLTIDGEHFNNSALYVVGDPKQSIYRFRGAEPQVFFETRKLFDQEDTKIYDLNINFRSNSLILDWVNEKFSSIRLTDDQYQPMLVKKENIIEEIDPQVLAGVYRYQGLEPDDIAKLIRHLKNNYLIRRLKTKKVDGQDVQYFINDHISFRDFMIILYKIEPMDQYVKKFTEEGIPVKIAGESKFKTEFVIRAYINLFKGLTITNPLTLAALKETLKAIYNDYLSALPFDEENGVIEALTDKLIAETKDLAPQAKALYLIDHLEWFLYNKEVEDFSLNAIKSKLYQMIEEVMTSDYYSGAKLAMRFEKYINSKIDYESMIDSDPEAVQIINVHKSKGLDAPIVIWLCCDKATKWKKNTVKKDGLLYLSGMKDGGGFTDALSLYTNYEKIASIEQDDIDELARLEYVGATRAKEALIFAETSDVKKRGKSKLFKEERYNLSSLPELEVNDYTVSFDEKEVIPYKIGERKFKIGEASLKMKTPSSTEKESETFKQYVKPLVSDRRPKGNVFGTIMHRAFELKALGNAEKIVCQVMEEYRDLIALDEQKIIIDFLNALLKQLDHYLQKLKNWGYTLYPEMTFSYYDDAIINGSIDLLCLKEDEALIIDYKSDEADYLDDQIFEEVLKERYQSQIALYEDAVKRICKASKITKKIIYFKHYDVEKSDVELKELEL